MWMIIPVPIIDKGTFPYVHWLQKEPKKQPQIAMIVTYSFNKWTFRHINI